MKANDVLFNENGKPYILSGKRKDKVYCIKTKCKRCGCECFVINTRENPNGHYCSPMCSGKHFSGTKSPKWKGGKFKSRGYVAVVIPKNHPKAKLGYRYIQEHRLVVEKNIGRHLNPKEFVHHLNGNKEDNRVENLALCTRQNHFDFIKLLQNRISELEKKVL